MPHIETQSEWEARMAGKILDFVRNEICVDLRFLHFPYWNENRIPN